MDQLIDAVLLENGGFFTRAEALDCGWLDRDLAAATRAGVIRRLRHGAYSPAETYDAADEIARHVLLARAALRSQRGPVALTGISAAAVHGLTLYRQDLSTVHLVRLDRGSPRHEVGTKHHRLSVDLSGEVEQCQGIPVVSMARSAWEVASMSPLESGVVTADSALRARPGLMPQLREVAVSFEQRPGSRGARIVMRLANGGSESAGESLSRVLFYRRGIPMPELQREVHDLNGRLLGIADFYWPEFSHLGEFDGKVKYGRLLRPGETAGDAVFREKRREDQMKGLPTWDDSLDVDRPHAGPFLRVHPPTEG
ncbi:MAG: type IV toxin-antitoxin system AbiEi family antitoxin domain-containing protein [Propionibacteriaceae bacterium]|nr:type IV toxin-antitoxin system AbiEi family antitoxin domain-containing protein [Propionibacteriaceae bacterium]